jgi:aspartate aminotransferase
VPTQLAAAAAIGAEYDPELVRDLQGKRDLLQREAAGMPHVTIWPTPASFYSFWDARKAFGRTTPAGQVLRTSDDVATYLIREAGVVTASGSGFMQDGYLRLSFATPDDTIRGGMRAAREVMGRLS